MRRSFLVGQRLYLRRLEESDLTEQYLAWLNDPEVTRYLVTGRRPATLDSLRAFLKRFEASDTDFLFAIVLIEGDRHIGNVTLNHIDWIHRIADTGLMIGEKDCWGKGYASEAWSLVVEFAFQRLGLHKVWAGAAADSAASIASLEKLGFTLEGRFRQEFFLDGEYRDTVRLGVLREEFQRYLGRRGVDGGAPGGK